MKALKIKLLKFGSEQLFEFEYLLNNFFEELLELFLYEVNCLLNFFSYLFCNIPKKLLKTLGTLRWFHLITVFQARMYLALYLILALNIEGRRNFYNKCFGGYTESFRGP